VPTTVGFTLLSCRFVVHLGPLKHEPAMVDKMVFVQSSVDYFLDPEYKPLFSFILRLEAGQGDTIDRLATLHSLLEDRLEQPRVVVSAQIAPVLLNVMFSTILEEADEETASRMIPVILERVGLLLSCTKTTTKRFTSMSLSFCREQKRDPIELRILEVRKTCDLFTKCAVNIEQLIT
ncbi:AP-5 complex subunit zeta-1, partial [Desmophyllum pertusum]